MMDVLTQKIILNAYVDKESYPNVYPLLQRLKKQGLMPRLITMDGHHAVIRAIKAVWPHVKIQRCLYHMLRQGLSWIRMSPKTQAGRELRTLLMRLTAIKSFKDRDLFFDVYRKWFLAHTDDIKKLPNTTVAFKDLKRTIALINNALPDMFHYLKSPSAPNTTNILESFYSRLKADFRRHRGLSETHKRAYLQWYCYFKNQQNSNTF